MYDVRALNELVAKESAFVDRITNEVGKVIVGQSYMIERILIGLLTGGHLVGPAIKFGAHVVVELPRAGGNLLRGTVGQ